MSNNRITVSLDTLGYVTIRGLIREEFDLIAIAPHDLGNGMEQTFSPSPNYTLYEKHLALCDGKGAYLDLRFITDEPPAEAQPITPTLGERILNEMPEQTMELTW